MRQRILFIACAMLLSFSSPHADDADEGDADPQIPDCGAVDGKTDIWQRGTELVVVGFSQTKRQWTGCLSRVRVEAWIDPVGALVTHESGPGGLLVSIEWVQVPVPTYATYHGRGKHFYVNFGNRMLVDNTHDEATLYPPPQEPPPPPPDVSLPDDPILVNPQHDGFHLTSAEDGVLFDIDADGDVEQVPWTRPGSDDAWLAMDRNGNGVIDNGSELFGNRTPAFAGQPEPVAANGFDALDFLQGLDYGRNIDDGVLDGRDEVFGRLLVWRDANHDGISQRWELETASHAGLVAIEVHAKESRRRDPNGNLFALRAKARWVIGSHTVANYAYNVWLRAQQ